MDILTVNKANFSDFLSFLQLRGEVENIESLVNIEEKSINTTLVSSNKTVAIKGVFNGSFFNSPSIGVDNIALLNNLVNSVPTEEVNLKINKNKLELTSPTNKILAKCILKSTEYVLNKLDNKKFETLKEQAIGNEFILYRENISRMLHYMSVLKSFEIILEGKSKELTIKTENNENEIVDTFELDKEVLEFKVKLGTVFKDLMSSIKEDVIISAKTDKPLYLNIKNDNYNIEYIVAPLK